MRSIRSLSAHPGANKERFFIRSLYALCLRCASGGVVVKITKVAALEAATGSEVAGREAEGEVPNRTESLNRYSRRIKAPNNQGK